MHRSISESKGRGVHAANVKPVVNPADPCHIDGAKLQNDFRTEAGNEKAI